MSTAVLHAAPSSPHVGRIEFGHTRRSQRGWAGTATIDYDGDTWAIELEMIEPFLADMIGFFDEIARPDWSGPTRWESEFQEVALSATGADGLAKLAFRIWWSRADELDNEREGELLVSREELPVFAEQLRELTQLKRAANQ